MNHSIGDSESCAAATQTSNGDQSPKDRPGYFHPVHVFLHDHCLKKNENVAFINSFTG